MEDCGTFGDTLGVFQVCSNRSKVKEEDESFFLELQAKTVKFYAKTKHFELSGGATKIQIVFELKVKNFKLEIDSLSKLSPTAKMNTKGYYLLAKKEPIVVVYG